jgi:hypothetical protein
VGETAVVSQDVRTEIRRTAVRRRAVGTRDRIIAHLAVVAEVVDPAGMASTRLAQAVGYPGSSVAFAQLLSGMERDGLISREVRGKRTYRIMAKLPIASDPQRPGHPVAALAARAEQPSPPAIDPPATSTAASPAGIDYDELADRVLVRLLRRLSELSPAQLQALERLLVGGTGPVS